MKKTTRSCASWFYHESRNITSPASIFICQLNICKLAKSEIDYDWWGMAACRDIPIVITITSSNGNATGPLHYDDVTMGTIAPQITSLTIVYPTVYSGADQSKHQSSASLAFVWGIHRGPLNSPRKWPVTRKMFPFDDVIMVNHRSPVNSPNKGQWRGALIFSLIWLNGSVNDFECGDLRRAIVFIMT